tara:strand:+ start:3847 stop:4332 length:486 start_codon:yes stop_codon:yes gene_type:complete
MALAEVPFRSMVLTDVRNLLTREWIRYLQSVVDVVNNAARKRALVSLTTQSAAISTTTIDTGTLDPGVYRVSYSARISRAASTSSSLTVTLSWRDGDVAQSQSGAAMTGNSTTTQQNGTFLVHNGTNASSANDVIKYATAYASSGGTTMQYSLFVLVEQIG